MINDFFFLTFKRFSNKATKAMYGNTYAYVAQLIVISNGKRDL